MFRTGDTLMSSYAPAYRVAAARNAEHEINPQTKRHPGYHWTPTEWMRDTNWWRSMSPGQSPTYIRETRDEGKRIGE